MAREPPQRTRLAPAHAHARRRCARPGWRRIAAAAPHGGRPARRAGAGPGARAPPAGAAARVPSSWPPRDLPSGTALPPPTSPCRLAAELVPAGALRDAGRRRAAACSSGRPGPASRSPTCGWPARTRRAGYGPPGRRRGARPAGRPGRRRACSRRAAGSTSSRRRADGDRPVVLAADAAVLAVLAADADAAAAPGRGARRLVLVAMPRADAARVAAAALSEQVAITLR